MKVLLTSVTCIISGATCIVLRVVGQHTVLEKLTRGVLHVSGADGLRYVDLTLAERLRLLWLFRNFRILPQHVLPTHQRKWISSICENGRVSRYSSILDREMACVIGTIVTSEPSLRLGGDERRRATRLPLRFSVRYGLAMRQNGGLHRDPAAEMTEAEGADISETGIAFVGPRTFAAGTELTVHFRLSSASTASWTRTRVIVRNLEEVKPGSYRFGAEFSIIHPRDRVELRQLSAACKSSE
jgi:hypothetical protein